MESITTTAALARFCAAAAKFDFVTVDTEFLRETTYWPILCLIQAATPDEAVLIDPMANGLDLTPFFELMGNASVVKVFHAARQDIEIFVKLNGVVPHPIFDTQVAASVNGHGDSISYDNLVQSIVGVKLDKSSRFTDWSARPLTEKQKIYALADVTHLRDVYVHLRDELVSNNRSEWMRGEAEILENVDTYLVKPADAWRKLKMKVNKPVEMAALQVLAAWREQKAQDTDQPRRRVLKDDAINELAVQRPTKADAFDRLRAVPRGFGRSASGSEIMTLIKEVTQRPPEDLPKLPDRRRGPSPKGAVGDLLRVLLKAVAEQQGVAARIIATSDDIDEIVLDDGADVAALKGWRRKIFGDKALAIKHGKIGLAATRKGIVEVPVVDGPDADVPEGDD